MLVCLLKWFIKACSIMSWWLIRRSKAYRRLSSRYAAAPNEPVEPVGIEAPAA